MAKLSKAALERKQEQKKELEKEISACQGKIHDLRNSSESRLAKTQKLKEYQQTLLKLKHQLTEL